jgi:hypothetical protein
MRFSDLALSKRLESAEGYACAQFAEARRRLFPESGAEWMQCAGAYAVFDGIDSPVTQSFGLGVLGEITSASLDLIEGFFLGRGAPALHEISPFAGIAAMKLLCTRKYQPVEVSSVLYRSVERTTAEPPNRIQTRVIDSEEFALWTEVSAKGWSQEHPEFLDFLQQLGTISAAREQTFCFLGEVDERPGAAAVLCLHEGVALFGGSATIPELRRHGLQGALLRARMCQAYNLGCDLAMMVSKPGSNSQRNAERNGFRIAYTRTKWQLAQGR